MQLEHIHIEAALQATGMQRLANELRAQGDLHLREVAAAGKRSDQVVIVATAIRQQAIRQQEHHRPTHEPHRDADRREAE